MVIPLVNKITYRIYTLIPHPVSIKSKTLVIADINDVILVSNNTYIITDSDNIHSITNNTHIVTQVEPIWSINKSTCEWESYKQNVSAMLYLCNYKKVGMINGTFMTETKYHRLLYLTERTQVEIDCPDGRIRDNMKGLHKLPLQCDITTDEVHWPAKQTLKIDIHELLTNVPTKFDSTQLPIVNLNDTINVHDSIKTLISELPSEDDPFTFDFDEHNLSLQQVQSYTIIAYGVLTTMVIINSIILGLMLIVKCRKCLRNRRLHLNHMSSTFYGARKSFSGLRDSIRERRRGLKNRVTRRIPNSPSIALRSLRSSLRDKIHGSSSNENPQKVDIGINTEEFPTNFKLRKHIHPAIPRK
jgi:hypothetical protein